MNKFLNWKSLTLLVAIIGVVVPIWIWRTDMHSTSLQFRIASQVLLQPDNLDSIKGLQVSIDGIPLESPYLSVLELSNDGEKEIRSSNFEAPLEIQVSKDSTLARAQVTATNPKDIEALLTWEAQSIKIKPLLLNPKDVVTISILTSGKKPEFTTRARIAGISAVPIVDSTTKPAKTVTTVILFLSSLALFIASNLTSESFFDKSPISLRKRSALLITLSTGIVGANILFEVLDAIGITAQWQLILSFFGMALVSITFAIICNWQPPVIAKRKIEGKLYNS
ncbi:MAG TPA: hypothetical protein VIE69_01920 [Methylophilaceae bacterium]|jgi:hypothetical protein